MTQSLSCERSRSSRQHFSQNNSKQLIIENVQTLHLEAQDARNSSSCLHSLGFLEIDYREHVICAAVDKTCDWLFCTSEFEIWRTRADLATHNGVLCLKGKPGAGKSMLMKHTLAHCKGIFPDSAWLVSASDDKTIKLWDVGSGKCLRTLEGHSSWVKSGSSDKTIKLWDAGSGKCLRTLKGHSGHVKAVAFSPNSAWLVSASNDKTIKLWDTGRCSRIAIGITPNQ